MPEAYVIEAVRTAVGKRNGSLAGVHPVDLGAAGMARPVRSCRRRSRRGRRRDRRLRRRHRTTGGQHRAGCPGWPPDIRRRYPVSRWTGNAVPASRPISFGAQAIMSGTADLIVAGGMQNMSQIPISSAMTVAEQFGFTSPTNESKSWLHRYGDQEISQFRGAELIAEKWNISREEMEQYSLQAISARRRRSVPDTSRTRSSESRVSSPTRVRATRRWRRWPASRHSSTAAA